MCMATLRIGALALVLSSTALADAAQARPRAQMMFTVGHLNGPHQIHRATDITLKRGVVGSRHPDFLWNPTRLTHGSSTGGQRRGVHGGSAPHPIRDYALTPSLEQNAMPSNLKRRVGTAASWRYKPQRIAGQTVHLGADASARPLLTSRSRPAVSSKVRSGGFKQ